MPRAKNKTTKKIGRPSSYTQERADFICAKLSEGMSLRAIVREFENMPDLVTIYKWMRDNPTFLKQYAIAKQESADAMAEEILDIADDESKDNEFGKSAIMRARLRVDTRRWLMAKMKPKKYGDSLDLTSDGKALPTPIFGGLSVSEVDHLSKKDKTEGEAADV